MKIEIKIDKLPNDSINGKITRLHKKVGDDVKAGDILFDIEDNKSGMPIKSTASGKIEDIKVKEGDIVKVGDILAIINGEKEETDNKAVKNGFEYFGNLLKPKKREIESDITIIGGGPGGYVAAIQAAKMGAKVVLVEKDTVGGTCLNRGCIPTKSLVRSAEVYKNLKQAKEFGCYAENVNIDIKKVIARKDNIVNQLVKGIHYLLSKHNVQVISGAGKIQDKETVYVKKGMEETIIKTKNIIIATGSKTSKLPIPGIDIENVIYSDEALELKELPNKLIIVGGGVIGMEFAFIFANFGVDVTVIEYLDEVLANLDEDIIKEISKIASNKGIKIHTGAKVEEIIKSEDGQCIVSFIKDNEKKYVTAEKVLMAVGRVPNFDGLDIEKLGIELNDNGRGIKVNDKMETNIPGIYAIGDVTNKIQLAHVASHQGIIAVKNIMGETCEMDYECVPSAIFTDPEIAVVGINEKIAEKEGIEIEVGKFPFVANGKALTLGESEGFIKIIKEKATGKVIGGAIIGAHATDLIAEITLAIKNGLTAEQIVETIHAHPTTAEVIHEAALAVEGGAIHFAE
ncbi:dihydrolipoyl dehydrogenase [Caloranaerobacter azorensis]|uniref:dihydrolipoyl dehydrogenase n=1 Tax=Caloranaerobacter azorensis TaxID=116090 RepID=UPI000A9FEA27|nr:dihydrolipoyl dehydrogenase [Caloranaerobacter azorensis]